MSMSIITLNDIEHNNVVASLCIEKEMEAVRDIAYEAALEYIWDEDNSIENAVNIFKRICEILDIEPRGYNPSIEPYNAMVCGDAYMNLLKTNKLRSTKELIGNGIIFEGDTMLSKLSMFSMSPVIHHIHYDHAILNIRLSEAEY